MAHQLTTNTLGTAIKMNKRTTEPSERGLPWNGEIHSPQSTQALCWPGAWLCFCKTSSAPSISGWHVAIQFLIESLAHLRLCSTERLWEICSLAVLYSSHSAKQVCISEVTRSMSHISLSILCIYNILMWLIIGKYSKNGLIYAYNFYLNWKWCIFNCSLKVLESRNQVPKFNIALYKLGQ